MVNSHPSSVFSLFHLRQALTLWPWLSWLCKPGVLRLSFACVYLARNKGLGHHTWLSLLLCSITAALYICSARRQKGLVFGTEPGPWRITEWGPRGMGHVIGSATYWLTDEERGPRGVVTFQVTLLIGSRVTLGPHITAFPSLESEWTEVMLLNMLQPP